VESRGLYLEGQTMEHVHGTVGIAKVYIAAFKEHNNKGVRFYVLGFK